MCGGSFTPSASRQDMECTPYKQVQADCLAEHYMVTLSNASRAPVLLIHYRQELRSLHHRH